MLSKCGVCESEGASGRWVKASASAIQSRMSFREFWILFVLMAIERLLGTRCHQVNICLLFCFQ